MVTIITWCSIIFSYNNIFPPFFFVSFIVREDRSKQNTFPKQNQVGFSIWINCFVLLWRRLQLIKQMVGYFFSPLVCLFQKPFLHRISSSSSFSCVFFFIHLALIFPFCLPIVILSEPKETAELSFNNAVVERMSKYEQVLTSEKQKSKPMNQNCSICS